MTIDAYITIAILALTFGLLIKTKLPPAAVFLGALVLTMTFRLAPLDQTLDGFSNSGMLTVGALFMVAAGMYSTGAITVITEKLIGRPKTLLGAQLRILPSVSIGSGLSAAIADFLHEIAGDNPYTALAVVFLGCIAMDTLVTNVASVMFMFPIALAGELGLSFMPFAITVMVGASCSFISPMGYQTNLMVYGPGGYKFTDYVGVGVPLTIIVGIITIILTPMFFGFQAP